MTEEPGTLLDWLERARGGDCFTDDLLPGDCLYAAFVRSPHAHARIVEIDREAVWNEDGEVVAVLTAEDIPAHVRPIPCIIPITNRDGSSRADPPRTLLAQDRVRHEGEALAMIIARTQVGATRAARTFPVRYRPLPSVSDCKQTLAEDAPQVRAEAPGNICFDWELGDRVATDAIFKRAEHVVEMELINNRIIVSPLETRNAIGYHNAKTGQKVLVSATQGVHWVRKTIAEDVLGIPERQLEVLTPRVGGSFGTKIFIYPEQILVLLASERLGVPVKWSASRTEALVSDTQGRDNRTQAAMALDADGCILAVRADTLSNLGAHLSNYAPFNATTCGAPVLCGTYRVGSVYARVRGVLTNTPPVDSYRGAGRPEANYVIERLIDHAASQLGFDRVELRRRNIIHSHHIPFRTATGLIIDSGQFSDNMERALSLIDYARFPQRRLASLENGCLRGIGLANFLETNGGLALARLQEVEGKPRESARIEFTRTGLVYLDVGTQCSGQGHASSYTKILSEALDLPETSIVVRQGDSERLMQGTGTGGSKSLLSGSTAILLAADLVREKACRWAASYWGVDKTCVQWLAGKVVGPVGVLTLPELTQASESQRLETHPFDTEATATIQDGTYGNGCHVCEVEINSETGATRVLRYIAVNDFGTLVSPEHVKAQLCGGIAQGIGQALFEDCRFDPVDGHLRARNLGSYHFPQARDLPVFELHFNGSGCATNRLGIKGCGEAGASAAPPAVMNAVNDALDRPNLVGLQMPATAQNLWTVMHSGVTG